MIPGPDTVPDAWQTLPPVEVSGTLRDGRSVSVTYQVCPHFSVSCSQLTWTSSPLQSR
jgi:hypothetical protein